MYWILIILSAAVGLALAIGLAIVIVVGALALAIISVVAIFTWTVARRLWLGATGLETDEEKEHQHQLLGEYRARRDARRATRAKRRAE